eukprot:CAMPEP_0117490008 /NCGR_PEP_ID=MMETSP0784-20121206/17331_1 /TAXON_ID=39447 /ORGANISM="" /LENGTH=416 /DNA_ID=CAMNT_0005284757 /DNA_START=52 /DNA_END=1299 /DNA_ORIENTATION=+
MAGEDEYDSEEEERRKRYRDEDYLSFRRKFDEMKRVHRAAESDSEKMKVQGNQFFSLGLYEQAAMLYSEALELQPKSAVLYCNRAMAYLKQGLAEQALADAEQSLQIDAEVSNIKAYWRKAQALLDLERSDESETVADAGLALQPGNNHLNVVRRKAREASVLRRLSDCEWVGQLQHGVEKRLAFTREGIMTMHVFGHPVPATFELSVEGNPWSMVVRMKPEGNVAGTGPPPPPIPYIFEFKNDDELWLCHPVGSDQLPTKFEGPGFDRMRRAPKEAANSGNASAPLDERCAQYITSMSEVLPLIPQQLPERPSDDEIKHEVGIAEKLSKLKRSYGLEVHQRAVQLAKDPSLARGEDLAKLARGLQQRFIARKILPMPEELAVEQPATEKQRNATAIEKQRNGTASSGAAPAGCLG